MLEVTLDRLNELLALTFEGASVVVKDQVIGYRRKKDLFILLVEAFGKDEDKTGPFVVKIGTRERLEKEIQGWDRCAPAGTETRPGLPQPAGGGRPERLTTKPG